MTTRQKPTPKPVPAAASRNWESQLRTAKGTVSIKRSKKSAPYAIQQNN
jgi:hypothetical protein